jgi:hypothetical protein
MPDASLSERADGRGTIRFGEPHFGATGAAAFPPGRPRLILRHNSSQSMKPEGCSTTSRVRLRRALDYSAYPPPVPLFVVRRGACIRQRSEEDRTLRGHGQVDATDPPVWSGRASQEGFVDLSAGGAPLIVPRPTLTR